MKTPKNDIEIRALELFERALKRPNAERNAFVETQASEDKVLLQRVQDLLNLDAQSGSKILTGQAILEGDEEDLSNTEIGSYRLLALIGKGGMGAVYKGVRVAGDFDHNVAIKVIRPGVLSAPLIERFERERQTLANFSHPNIARLYDGGTTTSGSPYIIMELIDGIPVTDWAEQENLDLVQRLKIFLSICEAVSYAHQNLIVHRDLTPSNVLVDTDGTVRLIDFGIAKPHQENTDAPPPVNSLVNLSFTPGYAAPERSKGAVANTLSDIYSLGKLLETLLQNNCPADLKAVITKATISEPQNRYSTARTFIEDIQRYRDGFPVTARQGGTRYKIGKFINRNKLAVSASSLALAGLVCALIVTTSLYRQAENSRAEAERRYSETQSIANTMMFDVFDEVSKVPGSTKARSILATSAQDYLDSLASDLSSNVETRLSAGTGYYRLARTTGTQQQSLGKFANSQTNYKKSKALLEALYLEFPDRDDVKTAYAKTLTSLAGNYLHVDGDIKLARSTATDALAVISGITKTTAETGNILGTAYRYQGDSYVWEQDYDTARAILKEGVETLTATPKAIRESLDIQQTLAILQTSIGNAYGSEGKMPEAITAFETSMVALRNVVATSKNAPTDIRNLTISLSSLSRAQAMSGQLEDALKPAREARDLALQSLERDSEDSGAKELLVSVNNLYAGILLALNRRDGVEEIIDEAVLMGREVSQKNTDVARGSMAFAARLSEASGMYIQLGRMDKACPLLNEALTIHENFEKTSELSGHDRAHTLDPLKKMSEKC